MMLLDIKNALIPSEAFFRQMNITPRSSKDKVISNACELVDLQETEIKTLKSQQKTLFYSKSLFKSATAVVILLWFLTVHS